MKRFNGWLTAAVLLISTCSVSAASREGLVVRLSSPTPVLRGDVDVTIDVTVTNTAREAITLLRWELPGDKPEGANFRITRDGQPVAYTGALVKRAAPTAEDYVRIEPGATLTYAVELTAAYDLSRSGTYAIEYLSRGARDGSAGPLRSDALYLWLQSRSGSGAVSSRAASSGGARNETTAGPITFTGNCSASRQTLLLQAMAAATTYADAAVNYFASTRYASPRYIRWFGEPTRERWNLAKTHYLAIQDAFATKPVTLDCSCTSSAYAYVFPTQHYKIYLCNAFWSAPMTGTDSKAGTLIHEMSHFDVVAGTDDWAYGQSAAAALAISNPTNALNNADNHEYFAENTPTLP